MAEAARPYIITLTPQQQADLLLIEHWRKRAMRRAAERLIVLSDEPERTGLDHDDAMDDCVW